MTSQTVSLPVESCSLKDNGLLKYLALLCTALYCLPAGCNRYKEDEVVPANHIWSIIVY
jgi:hypothetical protein